jgi:hypothetical protein
MHTDRTVDVELDDYMLYDTLHALAIEYTTTVDHLVNAAVRRLVGDVEFVRGLRMGGVKNSRHSDEKT